MLSLNYILFVKLSKILSSSGLWSRASTYALEFTKVNKKNENKLEPAAAKWTPPPFDSIYRVNINISHSKSAN